MIGEKFEKPAHFAVWAQQRQNHNGGDAQRATGFEIDARVGFRIVAAQQLAASDTFAGQSRTYLQARSDCRRARTGAGAADHFVSLGQTEGGSGRAGDVLGAFDQQLQGSLEFRFVES